ncbi:cob(I)yrinic acid a,c-diamide adenosyltransferase [Fervidobacterium sp. 2310opik-2]|uniref:cob(I)yrinic acid a,c-diamide adenosyltransferase n=1 Tax=Fervidobacterium sp. 2310opik-2 TaxID=1755815 RepID=UPI0013E00CB3|nr:cob(I)yrinic acid a,c-diamide adenosyltransferase [Fervidobacterium sp. 2310opik-2]KAF2961033.1 cob(I)yrinic acid a,c-diamide adenosyltransferase [Fervidobacterium sp. 2310opik-2]HOJ93950.1 cob(I)yrinic acid a,c-diamide adenosyltransferase [Fervidobacterium nodosum]
MGYIHVYTGNGKGKTTAAFGLALRAICAGKKVYIGQFIKGMKYSELDAVNYLPNLVIEQYGRNCFIKNKPTQEDIELARNGLNKIKKVIEDGAYDIVILDEVNVAVYYNLFTAKDVIDVISKVPKERDMEIILTGRYAPQEFIDIADLVTEMKEIKHYYQKGVMARKGIEF